jgi:hypothetical protein
VTAPSLLLQSHLHNLQPSSNTATIHHGIPPFITPSPSTEQANLCYRVNNTALSLVPVKSNHKLPKSRNKRRRRNRKAEHINVCSITDDSSLLQINDLVQREEYLPLPLPQLLPSSLTPMCGWELAVLVLRMVGLTGR